MNCANHPERKSVAQGLCSSCYKTARRRGLPQVQRHKRSDDLLAFTGEFQRVRFSLTPDDIFGQASDFMTSGDLDPSNLEYGRRTAVARRSQ